MWQFGEESLAMKFWRKLPPSRPMRVWSLLVAVLDEGGRPAVRDRSGPVWEHAGPLSATETMPHRFLWGYWRPKPEGIPPFGGVLDLAADSYFVAAALDLWGPIWYNWVLHCWEGGFARLVRLYVPTWLVQVDMNPPRRLYFPVDYDQAFYIPDPEALARGIAWPPLVRVTPSTSAEYGLEAMVACAAGFDFGYAPQALAEALSRRYGVPVRLVRPPKEERLGLDGSRRRPWTIPRLVAGGAKR